MYEYTKKTILQQPFSPRYEFCRSHACELCSVLHQAHSPQLLGHHSARKQLNTESRGWGPAAFHECGCNTEEMSLLDFTSGGGEAIPLQQGLTQWEEKAHDHHLTWRPLCLFCLRDTTTAPPGAHSPWNSSRSHMHQGVRSSENPCAMPTESENPSVYEGKQSPNNCPQNYYNSPYFFSRLSPQLSWWCRQTAEVHVQIAKL